MFHNPIGAFRRKADHKYERIVKDVEAGETYIVEHLPQGIYTVNNTTETLDSNISAAFTMMVGNDEIETTTENSYSNIKLQEERSVTIKKREGDDRGRTYKFEIFNTSDENNQELIETVTLKAGESQELILPSGTYRIKETDVPGFDLTFEDSSTVNIVDGKPSTVTITNTFTREAGSYHVIHEYYEKTSEGTYKYEGSSTLYTRSGPLDSKYDSCDVGKEFCYNNIEYTYIKDGDAYGIVEKSTYPEDDEDVEMLSDEDATPGNAAGSDHAVINVRTLFPNILNDKDRISSEDKVSSQKEVLDDEIKVDSNGFLTIGIGKDKDQFYSYKPDSSMEYVMPTKEGNQIIILRYFHDKPAAGSYKVIHVYYLRDSNGDTWEGASELRASDEVQLTDEIKETIYTEADVTKEPKPQNFEVNGNKYEYTYDASAYGKIEVNTMGESAGEGIADEDWIYRENNAMEGVHVTKEGDQIIILRYVRTEDPTFGSYNIVHEYYLKKNKNSSDSETLDENVSSGSFKGTLDLGDDRYTYTFEGNTEIKNVPVELDEDDSKNNYTKENAEVKEETSYTPPGHKEGKTYDYLDVVYGQKIEGGYYECDADKKHATATEKGDQIIILRYVRPEPETPPPDIPENPSGSYKVVHTYYLRDESGDHFEGRSGITTVKADLNNQRYTADSVEKIPICAANNKEYGYETSAYGYAPGDTDNDTATIQDPGDTLYKAETGKTWAEATEAGDQIIILKYIRTEPKKPDKPKDPDTPDTPITGTYKVVHTYYLRDEAGDHFEGRSGIVTVKADIDGRRYTADNVEKIPTSEATGREYGYETSAYGYAPGNTDNDTATTQDPGETLYRAEPGKTWVEAAETGDQIIILKYIRTEPPAPEIPTDGSYKVVHMYYLRNNTGDHFEGRSGIGTVEKELSDTVYTSEDVEKIPTCAANQRVYVYDSCAYGHVIGDTANDQPTVQDPGDTLYQADPGMEWVRATETGDQIIILKYYRRVNSGGGRPGSGSDSGTEPGPEPTEPTPETPANPVPETPPEPTPEQPSLPDPNAPDSPDRVTITEDGVPTTYVKVWDPETGEYIYLPEGEVPLWGIFLPKTGDMSKSPLWALLAMGSLGILWTLWSRKPGNEEDR